MTWIKKNDWLLESCYFHCFVCGAELLPPKLDNHGKLEGRALCLNLVNDKYGSTVETEERICDKCWMEKTLNLNLSEPELESEPEPDVPFPLSTDEPEEEEEQGSRFRFRRFLRRFKK